MTENEHIVDLTLLGCPMHTIKARETMQHCRVGQKIRFRLNDDAVSTIRKNLAADNCQSTVISSEAGTTIIEVTK
ncbi:sulfurtransferase TusA family protein [Methylophaga lonarensis]|nr:sulfurtransferase TusA family protein [Methylophaga lonarensis]